MNLDKEALALLLRDKTALGRLTNPEVHSVLDYLEGIGFSHQVAAPAAAPIAAPPIEPPSIPAVAAPIVAPPPAPSVASVSLVAPVGTIPPAPSMLASLEATIEKDVKAFFEPAPIAPIAQ